MFVGPIPAPSLRRRVFTVDVSKLIGQIPEAIVGVIECCTQADPEFRMSDTVDDDNFPLFSFVQTLIETLDLTEDELKPIHDYEQFIYDAEHFFQQEAITLN